MVLLGRPISDELATKANKILRTIGLNFGSKIQEIQDTSKKIVVGSYDFSADADSFTFVNADVSISGNTITEASHGLVTGDAVVLSSDGTLPTGLSASTAYYVIKVNPNVFKLATTRANAFAGTAIDITAVTGGATPTHTLAKNVFGQINLLDQGVKLPDKALILRTFYLVETTFTSTTTDNATIALSLNAANDITTATAIKTTGDIWDAGSYVAGSQDDAIAHFLKLTADRELLMTVGADTLTAGKLKVFVEYLDVDAF